MNRPLLTFIFVSFVWNTPTAHACSCGGGKIKGEFDIKSWVKNFKGAIFTGRVDRIQKVRIKDEGHLSHQFKVTFTVDRSWTGTSGKQATVFTGAGCCDCGFDFVKGERYYVVAHFLRGKLKTGICSPTARLDQADDPRRYLGEGKVPG